MAGRGENVSPARLSSSRIIRSGRAWARRAFQRVQRKIVYDIGDPSHAARQHFRVHLLSRMYSPPWQLGKIGDFIDLGARLPAQNGGLLMLGVNAALPFTLFELLRASMARSERTSPNARKAWLTGSW